MSTNYNRIKVADLETNEPDKILKTNTNGELEFSDISQKEYDPVSAINAGIVNNVSLQELGGVDKTINGVRIGRGNYTGSNTNTALGENALTNNISGTYNTAFGTSGLVLLTTGIANTIMGSYVMSKATTGSYNVAIGLNALYNNVNGNSNTAIGTGTLAGNVTSTNGSNSRNIAVGANAGCAVRTGNDNILIGSDIPIATNSGLMNGNKNVEIGKLNNLHQTGDGNVLIGWANAPTTTLNNNIIISDGSGNMAIRKTHINELLAPTLTNALITSGGAQSLITKGYVDNLTAVNNPTTSALSSSTLNTTYPNAQIGFRVHCMAISNQTLIYEKTSTGWAQYAVNLVA